MPTMLHPLVTRVTPQDVAEALERLDIEYTQETDPTGDPMFRIKLLDMNVQILFYGQDEGGYKSLQFHVGFAMEDKPSLEVINDWNRSKRYMRAYLDSENDPHLEYDLDFEGGLTTQCIDEAIKLFRSGLLGFAVHLNPELQPD